MKNKKRTEFDTLGSKKIDNDKLWGAQTQRSLENFRIGKEKMPKEIIKAIGFQKKAAAQTNLHLGLLDKKIGNAIKRNKAKRRIRNLVKDLLPKYGKNGYDYVFIAKENLINEDWEVLKEESTSVLKDFKYE